LAVLFTSLGDDGEVRWRTEAVVVRPQSDEECVHNFSLIFLGLPTLIELPMAQDIRCLLKKKIAGHEPTVAGTLAYANSFAVQEGDRAYGRWLFGYIRRRIDGASYSFMRDLVIRTLSLLLWAPRSSWRVLLLLARITGRRIIFADSRQTFTRL